MKKNTALHQPAEFHRRFEQLYPHSKNMYSAYLAVEREYRHAFGAGNKYRNFASFKTAYYTRIRAQLTK